MIEQPMIVPDHLAWSPPYYLVPVSYTHLAKRSSTRALRPTRHHPPFTAYVIHKGRDADCKFTIIAYAEYALIVIDIVPLGRLMGHIEAIP